MDINSACRVGTKITHTYMANNHYKSNEPFIFHDVCLIYEDQHNEGWYIALSQPTSKVGFGQSQGEAYINLVISLLCAIWHGRETKKSPYLGVESKKKVWESLDYVHRMSIDKQNELLQEVIQIFPRCLHEDVETTIESTHDKQYDTALAFEYKRLDETFVGFLAEGGED